MEAAVDFITKHWRDATNIVSLILAIWAFVKAKGASRAAKEAKEAAQKSFSKSDTISVLTIAVIEIDRICELQLSKSWTQVPALYRTMRLNLAKVTGENSPLSRNDRQYIRDSIITFAQMAERIDEHIDTQAPIGVGVHQLNREALQRAVEFTRMNQELQIS